MQFWTDLLLSPAIIISALVIGTMGEVMKRIVLGSNKARLKSGDVHESMWRKVYFVTLPAQPVLVGFLIGFIPWLPPAEQLVKEGYELAARVGTYTLGGVMCKIGYDTMVSTVLRAIQTRGSEVAAAVGGSSSSSAALTPSEPKPATSEPGEPEEGGGS